MTTTHIMQQVLDTANEAPSVFISFYDEDSQSVAQSIAAWFALHLGPGNVFSTSEIPPFIESTEYYIREKLYNCHFLVVIIGHNWEHLLSDRIATNQPDYMRIAIRTALEEGKPVVPVCTDGAFLPREMDLPYDLRPMLRYPVTFLANGQQFGKEISWVFDLIDQGQESIPTVTVDLEDFEDVYAQFLEAYEAQRWHDALSYLEQIDALGELQRRPFRLQLWQYWRQVISHIRHEEARPLYARLSREARTNTAKSWQALQRFLTEYPEFGDPQNLAQRLRPTPPTVKASLATVRDPQQPLSTRLEAAAHLAETGDPRPGLGVDASGVPDISWVRVPAGDFIYHYNQRHELPTFYIARYPITQIQFEAFIQDGGFTEARWWRDLARHEGTYSEAGWRASHYPCQRVSWYDAVAFTRWLSERLGYDVRLPIEPEWEKAARGVDGYIYPWGKDYRAGYANINEVTSGVGKHNLRQPVPVGLYPQAASPYGVQDMIGNVWEWCLNPAKDTTQHALSGTDKRPLRGGSWLSEWMFANNVRRRVQLPESRFPDFGFRIVCEHLPGVFDH